MIQFVDRRNENFGMRLLWIKIQTRGLPYPLEMFTDGELLWFALCEHPLSPQERRSFMWRFN